MQGAVVSCELLAQQGTHRRCFVIAVDRVLAAARWVFLQPCMARCRCRRVRPCFWSCCAVLSLGGYSSCVACLVLLPLGCVVLYCTAAVADMLHFSVCGGTGAGAPLQFDAAAPGCLYSWVFGHSGKVAVCTHSGLIVSTLCITMVHVLVTP